MAMIRPDVIVSLELYSEGGRQEATPLDHLGCIFEYEGENFECDCFWKTSGHCSLEHKRRFRLSFFVPISSKSVCGLEVISDCVNRRILEKVSSIASLR